MATITLYKPDGNQQFKDATDIKIEGGTLTFYWKTEAAAFNSKKYQTTVRFLVEEDIGQIPV